MSAVEESHVTFVLYLVLGVRLCSVLNEIPRLCRTWPAVTEDEPGEEQRQQERRLRAGGSSALWVLWLVAAATCLFTWSSPGKGGIY